MVDWVAITVTAILSASVTLMTSLLAFRIGIERRLTTVETTLLQHPPLATAERLRAVEAGLDGLRHEAKEVEPLKGILRQFGQHALRDLLTKGARP